MRTRGFMPALQVLCAVAALSLTVTVAAEKPPEEWDGLQKTKVKGIQQAYVLPGADIARYNKVMLDPIGVSFAKNWTPKGSFKEVSESDRELIKQKIGALAEQTFAETLSKNDGYPVVEQPGPDVMRITAELTDIFVNAPESSEPGLSSSYTKGAGRMTLVAELRDSETGALFARVVDKVEKNSDIARFANSNQNSSEARAAVSEWATILRKRLDAVHEAAGTKSP
jgi:hypothetical protein